MKEGTTMFRVAMHNLSQFNKAKLKMVSILWRLEASFIFGD